MAGRNDTIIRSWGLLTVLMIAVAVVVPAVHWPALSTRVLSLDDGDYLAENHLVQNPSWSAAWRFLTEVFEPSTIQGYYQPLAMISLMLDSAMGGQPDDLYVFHRTSLALHVVNTLLVIALLYTLFGQLWPAALVGLLFGLHPLTVEPICWVGERKTMLATFFSLSCLLAHVRYVRRIGWKTYVPCVVLYVLALMSKPTSTPIPLVLLLLDYWPLRRLSKAAVVEKIPFLLIAAVSIVVTVVSQRHLEFVKFNVFTTGQTLLLICHNLMFYPTKMIWPTNLSSLYPFPAYISLADSFLLASTLTCLTISVLLIVSLRWTRALLVGVLCYALLLAPTLLNKNYSPSVAWDKYVYLPFFGLLLVLGWFLVSIWGGTSAASWRRFRRIAITVVVLSIACAEAVATRSYLVYWRDTETFYRYMLTLTPASYPLHNHLGHALAERGDTEEAIEHYRLSLQLKPNYPSAHHNLGRALTFLGKPEEAIPHFKQALRGDPKFAEAYNGLGMALAEQSKYDEARQCYVQAIQLKREYPKAFNNLGVLLIQQGKTAEARECYTQALQHNPRFAEAHSNLGNVYLQLGPVEQAICHYEQALQLKPDLPDALNNLAWTLATREVANAPEPAYAVDLAERACQLSDHKKPDHLDTLAACYAAAGRFDDAIRAAQNAIGLAEASGQTPMAQEIRQRLQLYEQSRAYRAAMP